MKASRLFTVIIVTCAILMGSVQMAASVFSAPQSAPNGADKLNDAIVLSVGSNAALIGGQKTKIDPNDTAVTPVVENGTTLVPIRFVSESLKADVVWDDATKQVTVSAGNVKMIYTVGSTTYTLNGVSKELLAAPRNANGRVLVPLRAISEGFGKQVFYDRGLIIISDIKDIYNPEQDRDALDAVMVDRLGTLPSLDNFEHFAAIVEGGGHRAYTKKYSLATSGMGMPGGMTNGAAPDMVMEDSAAISAPMAPSPTAEAQFDRNEKVSAEAGYADEYSGTNLQVQGVDEADIVKTDGEYIYNISGNELRIAKVTPAEAMEISKTLVFDDGTYYPYEMYIDGDKLILMGNYYEYYEDNSYPGPALYDEMPVADVAMYNMKMAPGYMRSTSFTRMDIYDISNRYNPAKIRTVDIEGNYTTSRKIGSSVYVVSNSYFYSTFDENDELMPAGVQPLYRDTAVSDASQGVDYANIKYFPGCISPGVGYMNVAGINLNDTDRPAQVSSYLGGSNSVYASTDNMYVVANYMEEDGVETYSYYERDANGNDRLVEDTYPRYKYGTKAYKFALSNGQLTYQASTIVDGDILNQFSMDEHKGNFRIATTEWDNQSGEQSNNLFIFDEDLRPLGNIRNIAPGERIYSVRFMGDKAYMVTFRQVDPLFVIDVADASNPKILGELKIPGYSDYLHPYDETHLIGFGMNADDEGRTGGMKMAIFDVSDFYNPREMFVEYIGDRGTYSELLYNHKALLFSKERNLLAFPVSLHEVPASRKGDINAYGEFKYQGLYVYDISLENGFNLRGRVSHITDAEYAKYGDSLGYSAAAVMRGLYIGNNLYTISDYAIQAHDLATLEYKGMVLYK